MMTCAWTRCVLRVWPLVSRREGRLRVALKLLGEFNYANIYVSCILIAARIFDYS